MLAHELTHAMQAEMGQTRDEAEALKLMKCVTRDLTKEDQVSPKDSTIKLHRTTFTAIRCKMVQEWECASYVLQERPDKWEDLKTGDEEEDEEEDPEKPWCGLVYWDQGPGIGGPPPRFMCTGEGGADLREEVQAAVRERPRSRPAGSSGGRDVRGGAGARPVAGAKPTKTKPPPGASRAPEAAFVG